MDVRKKFFLKVLGALVLLILVWSVSAPAGPSVKDSQAAEKLKKAEEALTAGDFVKAESLLSKIIEKHPGSQEADRASYRLGDALYYNENLPEDVRYSQAVRAYKDALRREPKSPLAEWALLQVGNAYRLQGRFFMASTFYQRLVREYPKGRFSKEALFGRAESYYGIRQFPLSLQFYRSFVNQYPEEKRVLQALVGAANSLYYLEKYEEATAAYEKLMTHTSFTPAALTPEVRYPMAEACFRIKDYSCAKERFTEFYNLYPQHELSDEALARMGDVYFEAGQPVTALIFYQEAVALYPESDGAAIGRIRMADLALRRSQLAEKPNVVHPEIDPLESYSAVAQSKAAKPLTELAHYKKAQLLSAQGRHLEALKEFRRLRKKYPTGNLAEHSRAAAVDVLQRMVEDSLARNDAFKAIELYVTNHNLVSATDYQPYKLYVSVGEAYMSKGMTKRAIEMFRRVVEVEFPTPQDERASWLLGKAYLKAKKYEQAEKQFRAFLNSYPDSSRSREARFSIGKSLFLRKRFTEALSYFKADVNRGKTAPFSAEALLLYARTQRALAKKEQAARIYEKLLTLDVQKVKAQEPWRRIGAFEAADLLFEMESFGKALTVYLDAVERYPKDHRRSWAELQIARAYQRLGRKQEAKDAYQALAKEGGESLLSLVATEYGETVKAK